jgi:AraC-like DNA-binding protein/quercetin dioxygenase-like cupin family protein
MPQNAAKQTHRTPREARILPPTPGLDDGPGIVTARARECPPDHIIDWHTHQRAQLLYAVRGVMRVTTENGVWVVPPQRAVWIPPGIMHHVQAQGAALSLRSLYIRRDALSGLPDTCCVVTVSPLLRELIIETMHLSDDPPADSADARLIRVLLDKIEGLPVAPLHLPMTTDKRARRITDTLLDDPADPRTLQDWADELGASERTLARIFSRDTGMTFGQWRQQVRLLAALARLARGDSVTVVAFDLGYASQSAFIAMFRRALGKTPGRYFSE